MITKYYPNESCYSFIKNRRRLDIVQKVKILTDAASGLMHIHKEGFFHCDIAARNILVDSDFSGKISDFGLSQVYKRNILKKEIPTSGPLRWMAPETLKEGTTNDRSDVWSFGVAIWELFTYQSPYEFEKQKNNLKDVKKYVLDGNTLNTSLDPIPNEIKLIIDDCFTFKYQDRPSSSQIWKRLYDYYNKITC